MSKTQTNLKSLSQIAVTGAFLAICAQIAVPAPVPFTMQTFGIFTALKLLGGKKGTVSILIYILLGAFGAPVFASFRGGGGVLAGPTGGYIAGFLITGLLYLAFEKICKNSISKNIVLAAGLALCYLFGTVWYAHVLGSRGETVIFTQALLTCVVPYLIPDALKLALSEVLCRRLKKISYFKN